MQKAEQHTIVPASTRLDLCDKNGELFQHVAKWLRKHGKLVKPKLSSAQKEELNVVFKLMDEDGSGAIDVEEMQNAFNLLGYHFNKHEIRELISEVAEEGKEEVNYDEFLEVMTVSLIQMTNDRARTHQFPVSLISTAYTRKKLLEQILEGTAEGFAQVMQAGEEQQKAKEKERVAAEERARQAELDNSLPGDAIIRLSQVSHLSLGLLKDALSPKEIQALACMSGKLEDSRAPPARGHAGAEDHKALSPRLHLSLQRTEHKAAAQAPASRLHHSLGHHEEQSSPRLHRLSGSPHAEDGHAASRSQFSVNAEDGKPAPSPRTPRVSGVRHDAEGGRAKPRSLKALGSPRMWEPEEVVVRVCSALPALPPLVGGGLSPQDSYHSPRCRGEAPRAGGLLLFPGSPRSLLPALGDMPRR